MEDGNLKLLDPVFLKKLELLKVQARRAFPGATRGERRSTRRGSSVEFSDFRKYEPGDDFRHVDWNIYARLERLMLRQFVEEEDVRIDILIDASGSMHFGEPISKFDYARRAAAALAFLANQSHDRVGVAAFDSGVNSRVRAMRGRGHLMSVLRFLESLPAPALPGDEVTASEGSPADRLNATSGNLAASARPSGRVTDLGNVLTSYRQASPRPGILFVISDFLDSGDFRRQMKLLAYDGFDLNLLQVMAPAEIEPQLSGDLLLIDSESGQQCEVTLDGRAIKMYRSVLGRLTKGLEDFCRLNGIGYTMVTTSISFEELLLKNLIESKMIG